MEEGRSHLHCWRSCLQQQSWGCPGSAAHAEVSKHVGIEAAPLLCTPKRAGGAGLCLYPLLYLLAPRPGGLQMMALPLDTAFGPPVLFRGTLKVGHGNWKTKTCPESKKDNKLPFLAKHRSQSEALFYLLWQSNWLLPLPRHKVLLEQLTISVVSSRMPLSLVFSLPFADLAWF